MQQRQDHHDGQVPHARPKQAPRAALVALVAVEGDRFADQPQVNGQARHRKSPIGDAGRAEPDAERDEDEAVAKGHTGVARGVGPAEHAQAGGFVVLADGPAEGHEVRELPGE